MSAMSVYKSVPLSQLDHDPVALEGHDGRLDQIDDLKASIPVHGLINSLKVRVDADGIRYLVTAGNRRLATLKWLSATGGSIKGVKVTPDLQVPVIHSEESDDEAREISVAENMQRLPPTPVQEFRAFAKMAEKASTKEVAAHFGVTEKRVQQRLKLAALHPDILDAVEQKKLSLESAAAFTIEPDPAKQAAYYKKVKNSSWQLQPESIKREFTQQLVTSGAPIAKLIGRDAYVAAGGEILGDAFSEASYWISQDVIDRLIEEHWAEQKAAWLEEGWLFVETVSEFGKDKWGTPNVYSTQKLLPIGEGEAGHAFYTAEQKAASGVVFWPDGSRDPAFGALRPGTKAPGQEEPTPPPATLDEPGWPVFTALRETMSKALQAKVGADPLLALRVLVASLHYQMYCEGNGYYSPVGISVDGVDDDAGEGDEEAPAPEQGTDFASALTWAASQTTEGLLAYLGKMVGQSIAIEHVNEDSDALIAFVDPDVVSAFEADTYFDSVTKPLISLAFAEMTGAPLKDGKKEAMASAAAVEARSSGWLPPQLRTSSYAGPNLGGGKKRKAKSKIDSDADGEQQLAAAE